MTKTIPSNHLWFLNSLVTIRVSVMEGQDGISVIEHRVPYGLSPPLHVHRAEDEVLQVLEGEFRLKVNDQERRLAPGDFLLLPKGVPHTYRVESAQGGRCLTITVRGDFERFVRAVSRPAERAELPPAVEVPSIEVLASLREAAGNCGIDFVGPPLQ